MSNEDPLHAVWDHLTEETREELRQLQDDPKSPFYRQTMGRIMRQKGLLTASKEAATRTD